MKTTTENAAPEFSRKIAKEIAGKSFGHVLDCILGYADSGYDLTTPSHEFEQNFEEDLEEWELKPTERRIRICRECYEEMVQKFEAMVRKKYYQPSYLTKN